MTGLPRKPGRPYQGCMRRPLEVLAIEPWLGGSHERFLAAWQQRSRHQVEVLGLLARHWKWRMEGSGTWIAARMAERTPADVLLVSDYVDLARLRGLAPPAWRGVPALAYFHENQLTYPVAEGQQRDLTHGFTNVLTLLAAEASAFNSAYHLTEFAGAARALLGALPRPAPRAELEAALERSSVLAPGIDLGEIPPGPGGAGPLQVLFNQRREHDKDPLEALSILEEAQAAGAALEVVLLGEASDRQPPGVAEAIERLGEQVVHQGHVASRGEYAGWLGRCDLVLSSALHEFYGMAVLEALAAGCTPLLPRRLAYPEVLPAELHEAALYDSRGEAVERLVQLALEPDAARQQEARDRWRRAAQAHSVERTAAQLDDALEGLRASPSGS